MDKISRRLSIVRRQLSQNVRRVNRNPQNATLKAIEWMRQQQIDNPPIRFTTEEIDPNRFRDWRSDSLPEISFRPLELDSEHVHHYEKANQALDKAVGDAALDFVYKGGDPSSGEEGPVLAFSRKISRRFLDLYRGIVYHDMKRGIPMLPKEAGRLKAHGLTSEEILTLQPACTKVTGWLKRLGPIAPVELFDPKWRARLLDKPIDELSPSDFFLSKVAANFNAIPKGERELLERLVEQMTRSGRADLKGITSQLDDVAKMEPDQNASADERLIMELRQRTSGAGAQYPVSLGYIGTDPQDYLTAILEGEPDNPKAEFRQQMRFVYISGHLANTVIGDRELIDSINHMLAHDGQEWRIDKSFADAMNNRSPHRRHLPPVFRYGAQATLTPLLRERRSDKDREAFLTENPPQTLENVIKTYRLSERELAALVNDQDLEAPSPFASGGLLWRPLGSEEIRSRSGSSEELVKVCVQHAEMTEQLKIPVVAGISGTHDQITTMAGLVGIGISDDPEVREAELQQVRLSNIANMVPANHHSVHEILQSSKTFGLKYTAGPGYEKEVYPREREAFLKRVELHQKRRGFKLPSHYVEKQEKRVLQLC